MNRIKKILILIAVLMIVTIGGCSIKGGPGTGMFEMNSYKITISTSDEIEFDITDKNTIKKIRDVCKNYNWTQVPKEKQINDVCEIWIDFNNNWAVIGMYKDKDYGNLEKIKEKIGTPMYLPKGLNKYIQELIQENENRKTIRVIRNLHITN